MDHKGIFHLTAERRWHSDELLSCLDGKLIEMKKYQSSFICCSFPDIKPQYIEVFTRQMFAYFYVDSLM